MDVRVGFGELWLSAEEGGIDVGEENSGGEENERGYPNRIGFVSGSCQAGESAEKYRPRK